MKPFLLGALTLICATAVIAQQQFHFTPFFHQQQAFVPLQFHNHATFQHVGVGFNAFAHHQHPQHHLATFAFQPQAVQFATLGWGDDWDKFKTNVSDWWDSNVNGKEEHPKQQQAPPPAQQQDDYSLTEIAAMLLKSGDMNARYDKNQLLDLMNQAIPESKRSVDVKEKNIRVTTGLGSLDVTERRGSSTTTQSGF